MSSSPSSLRGMCPKQMALVVAVIVNIEMLEVAAEVNANITEMDFFFLGLGKLKKTQALNSHLNGISEHVRGK